MTDPILEAAAQALHDRDCDCWAGSSNVDHGVDPSYTDCEANLGSFWEESVGDILAAVRPLIEAPLIAAREELEHELEGALWRLASALESIEAARGGGHE